MSIWLKTKGAEHATSWPCVVMGCAAMMLSGMAAPGQQAEAKPREVLTYELRGANTAREIWIFPKAHQEEVVKLCETPGWGNTRVFFSANGRWILVEDGGESLGITLRVFGHREGLKFEEAQDADIDGKAEKLALGNVAGLSAVDIMDHVYVRFVRWVRGTDIVLVEMDGKGSDASHHVAVQGWLGFYDLGAGEFVTDLGKVNGGAVIVTGR